MTHKYDYELEWGGEGQWEPVGRFMRSFTALVASDESADQWLARYIADGRRIARDWGQHVRVVSRASGEVVWSSEEEADGAQG